MILECMEQNILPIYYDTTKYPTIPFIANHFTLILLQTLITFGLYDNCIEDNGMQQMADALCENKVDHRLDFFI